jgi:hypothetical protein
MTFKEYIDKVLQTEADPEKIKQRLSTRRNARIFHALCGMQTELGEMFDAFKRHIAYGISLDETNLFEECGDFEYYRALFFDEMKFSEENVREANIEKLKARYGDGLFTEQGALNRNTDEEMNALQKSRYKNKHLNDLEPISDWKTGVLHPELKTTVEGD